MVPPFRTTGYLAPSEPAAVAYRFDLRRGQRLRAGVGWRSPAPGEVFVDLFELPEDPGDEPRRRASADSGATHLEYEVRRDGAYLLRIQPELLHGGRYTAEVEAAPSLAFPIPRLDSRAVRSRFGVERDAGRRRHEGVDIFAPRGSPVVSAADGIVSEVGTNRLGGLVIWVLDPGRQQLLYYAHLDSQIAREGTRIRRGDTLGLVGNTGNARTTPPHLHFGIYTMDEGAVDPLPFIHHPTERPAPLAVELELVGEWARAARRSARLRAAPDSAAGLVGTVPRHAPVRVHAAAGRWYQVALVDGTTGFLGPADLESLDRPVATERLRTPRPIRDAPTEAAAVRDIAAAGSRLPVLARFGDYLFVRAPDGRPGWMPRATGLASARGSR